MALPSSLLHTLTVCFENFFLPVEQTIATNMERYCILDIMSSTQLLSKMKIAQIDQKICKEHGKPIRHVWVLEVLGKDVISKEISLQEINEYRGGYPFFGSIW